MAHLFLGTKIDDRHFLLDEMESQHCTQVLRHTIGDHIHISEGLGVVWNCRITDAGKKRVIAERQELVSDVSHWPLVTVAIAPPKNPARIEWVIEKGTEQGLRHIIPMITEHSERVKVRSDRLERIARSAAKQAAHGFIPTIADPMPFEKMLEQWSSREKTASYIGYCGQNEKTGILEDYQPGSDVIFCVGPEGDFSPAEIELAASMGFKAIDMGPIRMRTETAAVHAVGVILEINRHAGIL